MNHQKLQGPFNFDGREVFFDAQKSEFWDPSNNRYLDHEIGIQLIELYFGHQKAPLTVGHEHKMKKKLKKLLKKIEGTPHKKSHNDASH